jgi:hypothetical protein
MKPVDRATVGERFAALVNMSANELEAWLAEPESRRVGWSRDGGETVGHAAGRRLVEILRAPPASLDEEEWRLMRKAVGVIRRHRAQEPVDIFTSRWRYSLMNWGHDPTKGG